MFNRFRLLRRSIGLMTGAEIAQAGGIVALMMLAGLLESAVVALVVPLVYVIVDPDKLAATRVGPFLQSLVGGKPLGDILPILAGGLIVLLLLSSIVSMISTYANEAHAARCRNRLARELLDRITKAPYLWIVGQNSAVLARQIYEDVRAWRKEFIHSLMMIIQAAIMIIAPSAVAVAIALTEGFLALGVVAIICMLAIFAFRRRIRANAAATKDVADKMTSTLLQILTAMREVKVSGRPAFFLDRFDQFHGEYNQHGVVARMWGGGPASVINLLAQVGFVATVVIFWLKGSSGPEIVAQLALIGVVVSRVVPAFNRLAVQAAVLFRSAPFVELILNLRADLDNAIGRSRRANGPEHPVPPKWRTLALDNVSFRYPGSKTENLTDVTITLDRGRSYGFVGRSGAGKSTLVNLLLGLIEPESGDVRVDGVPLSTLSLTEWQGRFGYVPQDPFILDASLRTNVAFGEDADEARVREALAKAQLTSVVERSAEGIDAKLGERGRQISGGQAQRLAIARALYKHCDVLLLDEATSALDSITEAEVYQSLEALRGEVLVLMIAHRVSTLRGCDVIFVLDGGQIVDSGSYDALAARSELFRGLAAETDAPPVESSAKAAPELAAH